MVRNKVKFIANKEHKTITIDTDKEKDMNSIKRVRRSWPTHTVPTRYTRGTHARALQRRCPMNSAKLYLPYAAGRCYTPLARALTACTRLVHINKVDSIREIRNAHILLINLVFSKAVLYQEPLFSISFYLAPRPGKGLP